MAEASLSTEEDIVNLALARIGSRGITTLASDTTTEAVLARTVYPNVRDNLMRGHPWNFLIKRAQLTDSGTDPTFYWDNSFVLPSDFLRVVDVFATDSNTDRIAYKIETQSLATGTAAATPHKLIFCNSTTCYLLYVYQQTDPQYWPYDFMDAMAWALALELSSALTNTATDFDRLSKKAREALVIAKSTDGQEDYPDQFAEGTWITDRYGNDSDRWSDV